MSLGHNAHIFLLCRSQTSVEPLTQQCLFTVTIDSNKINYMHQNCVCIRVCMSRYLDREICVEQCNVYFTLIGQVFHEL